VTVYYKLPPFWWSRISVLPHRKVRTLLQQDIYTAQASCIVKSSDTQPVALIVFIAVIPYPLTNHMVVLQ